MVLIIGYYEFYTIPIWPSFYIKLYLSLNLSKKSDYILDYFFFKTVETSLEYPCFSSY